jgi:NAD(P)-dependent dehydrogenase (short-subunit alcohol dehydrogenase family)
MGKSNRVVVITGAARGMGRAMAERFLVNGDKVVMLDLLYDTMYDWSKNMKNALPIRCDLTVKEDIVHAREIIVENFGGVDILINDAGWLRRGFPLQSFPDEDWQKILDINLTGPFFCTKIIGSLMLEKGGSIVNICSMAGMHPQPGYGAYSPSKAALIMLTKLTALEWAPNKIRANAICPAQIETDMNRDKINAPGGREKRTALIPYGRIGVPDDVAKIAFFLTSDDADYITGETILADGGMNLRTMREMGSI